jgi:GH24 family phage-related lysozyme (muramidase)
MRRSYYRMPILSRRECITLLFFADAVTGPLLAQAGTLADTFGAQLNEVDSDPNFALATAPFRELSFRQPGPTEDARRGNANLPRRWSSDKPLSERAVALIIAFEVTSAATYAKLYSHPIWPQESSGVTIGIGYDLGYADAKDIKEDWLPYVGEQITSRLQSVAGFKGSRAKQVIDSVRDVQIEWSAAQSNFVYILKLFAGETIRYFPNTGELSADSFGALVSLVYNRGSATTQDPNDPLDRRAEMRQIKQFCVLRQFDRVPEEIRKMKRLWQNGPAARGLQKRRELEADLFEIGLS